MTGRVEGKRALIYGGGTGLGLACAEALLEAGASVFITGRRPDKLASAQETMARWGRIGAAAGDFTNEADVARVTGAAVEFLNGLDTLVVSSGRSAIGSVLTATRAQFEDILKTNLTGPFLAVQAAVPHLIRAAPASIVLIASVVGTGAFDEFFDGTMRALLTKCLAAIGAEHRVRVNAISPSLVLTELAQEILAREADPAATLARRESQHPLGRLGQPRDIGNAAVYLAGDESSWMTGQNHVIDGGLSIA
jgi:NAD(P)-dependent dehydrogenase (short-subunit alcohol dehydrogenase family)